ENFGGKVGRFTSDDTKRALEMFDGKLNAKSFDDSKTVKRTLTEMLDDNTHWYGNDRKAMVNAIATMTPEEARKYKSDAEFRNKLDKAVTDSFGPGPGLEAARHFFEEVEKDGKPHDLDVVAKLKLRAFDLVENTGGVKAGDVIRDIQTEFRKDRERVDQLKKEGKPVDPPELRERILNPKTAEDKKFSEE